LPRRAAKRALLMREPSADTLDTMLLPFIRFEAKHLIEVGAHVRRDPRFRPVGWRRWASPPRSRRRLLPPLPPPPPAPPPPPPPPRRPPPPLDHGFLQGEYVHEWTTSMHVSFRRRAPGLPLTIFKNRFRARMKKIKCIDLTRD